MNTESSWIDHGMSRDLAGKYRLIVSQRARWYFAGCRKTSKAKVESSQSVTEIVASSRDVTGKSREHANCYRVRGILAGASSVIQQRQNLRF